MKKITIIALAVTVVVIAALIFSGLLMIRNTKEHKNASIPTSTVKDINDTNIIQPEFTNEVDDYSLHNIEQAAPQVTAATPSPTITPQKENTAIASITIQTDRKTRTYDVMPNVDENTLKENIGYLPSSSWFGEEGLCVLMGHRDTDFSILQYLNVDDVIIVEVNGSIYRYSVANIEIVDRDKELSFGAMNGSYLVLVTCYPFRYSGNAPNKYIIYAVY